MINISPFAALRPDAQQARFVASRPYDVLSSKEAKVEAQGNPNSFLHITKSEIDLQENTDIHSQEVYDKAKENLDAFVSRKILFRESKPCYYIYKLTMNGKSQAGLVCGSSLDDYDNGLIKKHEFTRPEKEQDRINHIKTTGAQTGNVFLAYKEVPEIDAVLNKWMTDKNCQYDFIAEDGIQHSVWIVNDDNVITKITELFKELVPCSYIADGHHRAASAAKVRTMELNEQHENNAYFLTTLFPANQLHILDYNRIIKDTNDLSKEQLIDKISARFEIEKKEEAYRPEAPGYFGMYLDKQWYQLKAKPDFEEKDPILPLNGLIVTGKQFAGELDVKNPTISPIYGNMDNLGEIFLIFGTNEILYPDCLKLSDMLEVSVGTSVEIKIGENLCHDWILAPLKESEETIDEIGKFFLK